MGYRIRHLPDTYVLHHAASTSFDDPENMESSRLFAITCHSFMYQPTARNQILTGLTWLRSLVFNARVAWPGVSKAIRAYRSRRLEWERFKRADAPAAPVAARIRASGEDSRTRA
jgi:hypothetical protein